MGDRLRDSRRSNLHQPAGAGEGMALLMCAGRPAATAGSGSEGRGATSGDRMLDVAYSYSEIRSARTVYGPIPARASQFWASRFDEFVSLEVAPENVEERIQLDARRRTFLSLAITVPDTSSTSRRAWASFA